MATRSFWSAPRWLLAGLAFVLLSLAGYTIPYALAGLPVAAVIAPPWGIAVTVAVLTVRPCSDVRHWVFTWLLLGGLHGLTFVWLDSLGGLPRWGVAALLAWMVLHLAAASAVAVGLQRASLRFERVFTDSREAPFWGVIGAALLWVAFAVPANVVGLVFSAEWPLIDAVRMFVRCLVIGLFFLPLTLLWSSTPSGGRTWPSRAWWQPALQALGFAFVLCLTGVVGWFGAELPVLIWFGVAAFAPVRVALLLPMGLMLWVLVFAYGLDAAFMRREGFDPQSALLRFLIWLMAYLAAVHLRARLAALVRDNEASERLLQAVMSRNPVGILIRPVRGGGRVQMNAAFRHGLDQASDDADTQTPADSDGAITDVEDWLQRRMAGCELGVIDNGEFKPLPAASLLTPSIEAQAEMKIDNAYLRWEGGATRFVKLSTALVRDAQGRISHGILYAEDRTDVSMRSQLLQAVIDAMPVGVLLREITGATHDGPDSVLVNPAHVDLYGLTAEEAFGAQPLPPDLRVETAQGDVVFGGPSMRRLADLDDSAVRALREPCPVLITRATGVRRHAALMISPLNFASRLSSYQLLLTIDTHGIEAQRRLLDAVVERLPIGFSILSATRAEPVRINARQLSNLGLSRPEYEAGPTAWGGIEVGVWSADGQLTALPYRSPLQHSLETVRELDEPHAYIRRPDGSMCYVHMSTRLLFDENGYLAHVLGFAADRTELVTQQLLLGHIVRHSPVGIVVRQVRDGQVALVNGAMSRVLSADPATLPLSALPHLSVESGYEVRGELIPDISANPMWLSENDPMLKEGEAVPRRVYVRHEDGQLVFAKLHRVPVPDIAGQPIYHIAYAVDETLLRQQTRLLRSLIEALPTGVCVMEIKAGDPNPVYVNKSMASLLGQTPEQTMGHTPAAPGFAASFDDGEVFASGNGQVRAQAYIAGLMERGFVEQPRLLAITRSDGSARVADLWARPIHAPDGEIEFVVLVASDQTESHTLRIMADAANNRLLVANERLSEIVSHMPCGLIAFDGRGLMLAANQMVKDMLDMPATLFTQPKVWWDDLTRFQAVRGEYGDGDVEAIVTSRRDILHSNRPRRYERQRVNGHVYEVSSAPLARGGIVTTYTDITERKANEAQIRQLAFYDALTGLPNRRLLLDRVGQALQAAVRNHWFGAVFFLDLDQFKNLNDTRGHDAGDALLKLMGERLAGAVRSVDTVSRMGGDEFVVLMERLGNSDAEAIQAARRIAAKVHGVLMEPYVLGGDTYSCTCSIGIALLGDASESVEAILKQADIALYQAKDAGRNAIRFFDHTMQAAVVGRAELEAGLRLALARQEFVLYYQPQIDRHGRVFGVETLLRWVRPAAPAVSPGVFIGVAEACGVIVPIGLWVFEQVCAQVAAWAEVPHMAGLRVSVNLSARQLQEPDVVEAFAARLQSSGVDPQRIAVELTESLFIGEHGDVLHKLHALKALGLHLSMDDFGTGYSSLSQLHRLPLDEIKIDQAFVRDIESDPGDAAVVRAVIAMGLALGLDVVAEGVETEGQRRYLAEQGATSYQGYLFGYPMAGQDIERWLEQPPVFWPGMLS